MSTNETFTLTPLPYAYDALAPEISEETLRFHHDKHHAAYVAKLNELTAGTPDARKSLEELIRTAEGALFNNAAQAWNHTFYFAQFAAAPQPAPGEALAAAIDADFGSLEAFRALVEKAALALFGSGWVWLVRNASGKLQLVSEPNAGNPLRQGLTPLMTIDVWEHAYYIDYRNRRADSVKAFWQRLDWSVLDRRYTEGR